MLFLHISDIHFKRQEAGQPDDPNRALRNDMVRDVRDMRHKIGKDADGILISGDVAFHGIEEEYDFAYRWLEAELCPAAGCPIDGVFVVPGNHDVDRSKETGPAQVAARDSLRAIPAGQVDNVVRAYLRDKVSADVIFGPLEDYNRFAAKFVCALRPYIEAESKKESKGAAGAQQAEQPAALPYAYREVKLSDDSRLKMWGFSTVIVSDRMDAKDKMLVDPAAAQIEVEDDVTHLVMCHHPFNWLRNGAPFEDRINTVAKIQLFGHEHTRRMDEGKRYLRVRAGALQPERDEKDWKPGYNWLDIDVARAGASRHLLVKAWVRMHEGNQFLAVPDPDKNEIWENSFALPAWNAQATPVGQEPSHGASPQPPEVLMTPQQQPVTVRSVTIKIFKLKEHEQRRLISLLGLDREGDRDLRDYERAINAVRRSKAAGKLEELDKVIDETLKGGQPTR